MTDESKTMTDLVERLEDHAIHFDSIQYLAEAADIRAAIATIEAQSREIAEWKAAADTEARMKRYAESQLSTVRRDARSAPSPYDAELGKISDQDKEYAAELLDDLSEGHPTDTEFRIAVVSQWLRKSRYEAVVAVRAIASPVHAGEGPGPSTLAAEPLASPSVSLRGEPAPDRAIAAATEEEIALALINETRRQHNLPPVEWADPALNNDKKSWLLRARAVLGVMENHDARAQANQ